MENAEADTEADTEVIADLAEVIKKWSLSNETPDVLSEGLQSLSVDLKTRKVILKHKIEENLLRLHITFNQYKDRKDLRSTGSRYYQIDLNKIPDWLNDIPEYNATKFIVEG